MDAIGPTFKKLRERVNSTERPGAFTSSSIEEKMKSIENELSKKRRGSTDDPFYENTSKLARTTEAPSDKSTSVLPTSSAPASAQFIRDQNLRSSQSKEKSIPAESKSSLVSGYSSSNEYTMNGGEAPKKPSTTIELLDRRASRVAKRSEISEDGHANEENGDIEEDDDVTLEVLEEMHKLEESFPILAERYRLLDKIGEGTFSTVYKAEAVDGSVMLGSQLWKSPPLKSLIASKSPKVKKKNPLVALKQIYVTSSPNRIHNELNLLFMLSGNSHVAPLLDILRYQDQVLAILPYYQHADFRDFYRDLPVKGIKKYLWELLSGLEFMHSKDVIHRDLKPTNFLYDPFKGKGVLVDFGLAEKVPSSSVASRSTNSCPCLLKNRPAVDKSLSKRLNIKAAYPKLDQRPPRRANRAGTRGFRAPEVLFKCTNQSTKIDIWSAGVIGLSLIARKFPMFNSPDDIDALMEIIIVFGVEKLQKCAELHGCGLEISAPNVQSSSFNGNLVKFLGNVLTYEEENGCIPPDSVIYDTLKFLKKNSNSLVKPKIVDTGDAIQENYDEFKRDLEEYNDLKHLLQLLYGCFSMDASKRLAASQLLKLPFFDELEIHDDDEVLL